MAAFPAEEAVARSLTKEGINLDQLWSYKAKAIGQTKGLSITMAGAPFDSIGGVDEAKTFFQRLINGRTPFNGVVFIDEIEKTAVGAGKGDLSGVGADALGQLLTHMNDTEATGVLLVGPPGCTKSMIAKSVASEAQVPLITFDIGATQGSLVGESQQAIRTALKTELAITAGRSLWIATCNDIAPLPPALLRRLAHTFYFDLPTESERRQIWGIYQTKYGLDEPTPPDHGWSGANIKLCCMDAHNMRLSLKAAALYVVPEGRRSAESIQQLRQQAHGRYLSASYPGFYKMETSTGRDITL